MDTMLADLTTRLSTHGIDLATWGTGQAKTLGHLASELAHGECVLLHDGDELVRRVYGVAIWVYAHAPDGTRLLLKEDRQEYRDGRVVRRNLAGSVGEKCRPGESPLTTAQRGLREELGIDVAGMCSLSRGPLVRRRGASLSYPGLVSEYLTHRFSVTLGPALMRPAGYIEEQPDKRSIFLWTIADGEEAAATLTLL